MVGLHVGLEHGDDRPAGLLGLAKVILHELGMRIDNRQLLVRPAPEEVACARRLGVEERSQDHAGRTIGYAHTSR